MTARSVRKHFTECLKRPGRFNMCNPNTKADTGFPFQEYYNPITSGPYQNCVERELVPFEDL